MSQGINQKTPIDQPCINFTFLRVAVSATDQDAPPATNLGIQCLRLLVLAVTMSISIFLKVS